MTKDGVTARTNGTEMSGSGLKKKYRANSEDEKSKGKATRGKK